MCSQTRVCKQRNTQVNLIQMWGVEVWLASAHFCERVQLADLRDYYGRSRHASCTWCNLLSEEMGPDIRQCGGAGPHTVPGGRTV